MKRFLWISLILFVLLIPFMAWGAAGTVTCTTESINDEVGLITITWTADSGTAAVTNTVLSDASDNTITFNAWVFMAVSDPGTPSPTAAYDIYIDDENDCDIFAAELEDRSQTATEQAWVKVGSAYPAFGRFVDGYLKFDVENNSTNSATGVVRLYYYKYRKTR
jgi:hypothetical protein